MFLYIVSEHRHASMTLGSLRGCGEPLVNLLGDLKMYTLSSWSTLATLTMEQIQWQKARQTLLTGLLLLVRFPGWSPQGGILSEDFWFSDEFDDRRRCDFIPDSVPDGLYPVVCGKSSGNMTPRAI